MKKSVVSIVLALVLILALFQAVALADDSYNWEEPHHADVMIIACHSDDDQLYLGAVIPIYLAQGKSVVVVFMTPCSTSRKKEAEAALWAVGVRQKPVFGPFADHWFEKLADAKKSWPKEKVEAYLVEQVRIYTSSIIVSQDVKGEYGHKAHIWMVEEVQKIFNLAGDPKAYPESAEKYGVWNPLKLYLHLFKENKITLDVKTPLAMYDGKTAFEVAKMGYSYHRSQVKINHHRVGEKPIDQFGLAQSKVGFSTLTGDMFESVDLYNLLVNNPKSQAVAKTSEFKRYTEQYGFSYLYYLLRFINERSIETLDFKDYIEACGMPFKWFPNDIPQYY
ncbi:MAG: PIG-L family deacetylase [Parcubacteria group bacterium]